MLRRIIAIPEAVYYRGRFRASMAWAKVGHDAGRGDPPAPDEAAAQAPGSGERLLPGGPGLRVTSSGSL